MSDLDAAAAAAGLRRDWTDADGRAHRVDDAVLEAVLARLDISPATEPFLSTTIGTPVALPDGLSGTAELALEDGNATHLQVDADGMLPGIGAIGYHRLTIGARQLTVAVAPPQCPAPPGRAWGVGVQIPALRDERRAAFGDLGTLASSGAALGRVGAQAVAISPTHALFPADPTRFSPYAPSSRLFYNGLLADATLVGAAPPPSAAAELIDWKSAWPDRLHHLRQAFDQAGDPVRAALATYRRERGSSLEAHARFDALHAALGGNGWQDWPLAYRDPTDAAVQRFAAEHPDDIAFHAFLQWLTDLSLAAAQRAARADMAIGLIADLAVGTDGGGSHAWSRRDELLTGLTIGAPPDPLGPDGQNWGIAALDPFALGRTGFAAFIETIRVALRHAGGLRIDHAIGLDRLWVVPEGATASDGAYLSMPGDTLKHIIAIEAHRAEAIVIAEDLGTVPPGLRDDLAARGMLGMRVLPFERDAAGEFVPPARWDADAVAMTGTHDTPTVAGWWCERDIDWRRRFGRFAAPEEEAERRAERDTERASLWRALDREGAPPEAPPLDTILAQVAAAPAPLAIVPLEDLLALEEQPNIPGTVNEHPNWRRRMPADTASLLARPDVAHRARLLTSERPG